MALRLDFDEFKKLDKAIIEKLGHDEVGRCKWSKLSQDEQYDVAYVAVHSESNYECSLEATNFHKLLEIIQERIGGEDVQRSLIQQQLSVSMKSLSFDTNIANELRKIHDMNKGLGMRQTPYTEYFWKAYRACSMVNVEQFKSDMEHSALHAPLIQLKEYYKFATHIESEPQEYTKIIEEMVSLVRLLIRTALDHESLSDGLTPSGSFLGQPLVDWDAKAFCWVDLTTCDDCTEGFECRKMQHLSWNPNVDDAEQWEFYDAHPYHRKGGWRNRVTDCVIHGVKHQNMQLPPVNNAHHWKRCQLGWENKYTNTIVAQKYNPVAGKVTWKTLTPRDFCTINESILLLSYSRSFCEYFGREKVLLERNLHAYNDVVRRVSGIGLLENDQARTLLGRRTHTMLQKALMGTFHDDGTFVPDYPDKFQFVAQVKMPSCLSDPDHWGHLIWMFCEFMDSLDRKV
jgi:hypothetical protein